jgi:hypothetical protein
MLHRQALLMTLALASAADASAQRLESPCVAYWRAPAVFVGRVESIARVAAGRQIVFTIVERFRGPETSALTLAVDPKSACAGSFRTGREYFVYADRDRDGRSFVVRCARTTDVENGAADHEYARSVKEGRAPPGTISGQVVIVHRDLAGRVVKPPRPAADVSVRVSQGGAEDRIVTNQAGDFSVASRGPGAYAIALDVPERFVLDAAFAALDAAFAALDAAFAAMDAAPAGANAAGAVKPGAELREARDCAEVELRLLYDGRVAGRIVDAQGRPVAGLTVDVATPSLSQSRRASTDRDGRYAFAKLPPGRFVIAVEGRSTTPGGKPSRVFLPGTNAAGAAAPMIVGEGGHVQAPEFRLPASVKYVAVHGFVLDADGTPAEDARVYLKGAGEGDRIVGEPVVVDFVGRFVVAALAGTEYSIFAERTRGSRVDSAEPIRVVPAEGQKPITLTLHRRY